MKSGDPHQYALFYINIKIENVYNLLIIDYSQADHRDFLDFKDNNRI